MSDTQLLVVDDEPGITRLCERLLIRAGYAVTTFTDPGAAISFVEKNRIDLLLVDIRMPEISGFDVIARVKQHQPDIAVLVMTGFGTVDTAIQALRQGVDGLLLKPFDSSSELLLTVKQALEDNLKKRDIARIQALRPIFDVTKTFLAETQPGRLVEIVVDAVCEHLRSEDAAYYQYSEDDKSYKLLAGRGITMPAEFLSSNSPLIKRTNNIASPLWINATGSDIPGIQSILISQNLNSCFIAPISSLKVCGVLYVGRKVNASPFREAEWEMFLLIIKQASLAMENAKLYEELREYVKRIEDSQQALIRAEKMAAAGRLTASIAHEINNPLQAVQNCMHLATRSELSQSKRREYIDLANHELDRLMRTVQRMLDFYRPGSVDPQRVNIVELLRRVIKLLSTQLGARNIQVITSYSSKIPTILAVSSQLEQVFINLILNAFDAMPGGGELRVTAQLEDDLVEILIQDTGPGVSEENRTRIFEPFVSTKKGGTGLGLTVSYGIIAAHGGSLDLVSGHGPGACFRVSLPVKEK
jgi:signal transduction histidine kinase/DNA-binding response OmpR family regulator